MSKQLERLDKLLSRMSPARRGEHCKRLLQLLRGAFLKRSRFAHCLR